MATSSRVDLRFDEDTITVIKKNVSELSVEDYTAERIKTRTIFMLHSLCNRNCNVNNANRQA